MMLVLPDNMIGKPVGFTCSTFDLLHAGHILMLAEAKSICDYLIVALQMDPSIDRPESKNKPVQSIVERYVQLSAVKFVDEIIVYQTEKDLEDMLCSYQSQYELLVKNTKIKISQVNKFVKNEQLKFSTTNADIVFQQPNYVRE